MMGVELTGETARQARVDFADLPLLEEATNADAALAALVGTVGELRDRLWAGRLDFEARVDLAAEAYEQAARLQSFALALSLAVQR